jgi:hypothetical protein
MPRACDASAHVGYLVLLAESIHENELASEGGYLEVDRIHKNHISLTDTTQVSPTLLRLGAATKRGKPV